MTDNLKQRAREMLAAAMLEARSSEKDVRAVLHPDERRLSDLKTVMTGTALRAITTALRGQPASSATETDALQKIVAFVRNYFEPWGSWKTAWWEGEVSDEAAFSDNNALKHVSNLAERALLPSLLNPPRRSWGDERLPSMGTGGRKAALGPAAIFEAAVAHWHAEADAYPYAGPCPDCRTLKEQPR